MIRRLSSTGLLACVGFLSNAFAQSPKIIYTKFFKGSKPEFVSTTIEPSGQAVFNEDPKDDNPVQFQLPESDAREIFDLAAKLDHFKHPIESGLKVANMGIKTFHYENGAETAEVKFNYSEDPNAKALADWFERITESEEHLLELDRTVHFDKLGVNDVLLQLEITYDHKRLVDPPQFLPLLDRVVKNESYLHIARERAASLAEAFRKNQAGGASESPTEKSQQ
jgi:hypothetical protein